MKYWYCINNTRMIISCEWSSADVDLLFISSSVFLFTIYEMQLFLFEHFPHLPSLTCTWAVIYLSREAKHTVNGKMSFAKYSAGNVIISPPRIWLPVSPLTSNNTTCPPRDKDTLTFMQWNKQKAEFQTDAAASASFSCVLSRAGCVVLATFAAWLKVNSPRCLCFALGLGGGLRLHHTSCADQMEARFMPSEGEKHNVIWFKLDFYSQ